MRRMYLTATLDDFIKAFLLRRCVRHHRDAARHPRQGRRLHDAFGVASPVSVAPLVSPNALQVRRAEGARAGRPCRGLALRAGGSSRPARAHRGRPGQARPQPAGQDQLRHRRRGHRPARDGRDDQAAGRAGHGARALQVGAAGADRAGRWTDRPGGAPGRAGAGLHPRRQGPRLRRDLAPALGHAA